MFEEIDLPLANVETAGIAPGARTGVSSPKVRPTFASAASTYTGSIVVSGVPLGAKVSKKPNEYWVIMGVWVR